MEDSEFKLTLEAVNIAAILLSQRLQDPITGYTDELNASGDKTSCMDKIANDLFVESFSLKSKIFGGIASEELSKPKLFGSYGKYVIVVDPLDGSANLEVNGSVGSIFGIFPIQGEVATEEDFLQPTKNLVMAGYVLYSATLPTMVIAYDNKVIQYNFEKHYVGKSTEYKQLTCPEEGNVVAINSGNYPNWDQLSKNWFDTVVEYGKSSFRYSGCMVMDFHRILIKGGLFAYPGDRKSPKGKLRLLYENGPLAYIMHAAGGISTTGDSINKSILDIVPTSLHQTTPVFLGSKVNIQNYFKG